MNDKNSSYNHNEDFMEINKKPGYPILLSVLIVGIIGLGIMAWSLSSPAGLFQAETNMPISIEPPSNSAPYGIGQANGQGCAAVADNCPDDFNPDQKDSDGDGIGDACDEEYNEPSQNADDGC